MTNCAWVDVETTGLDPQTDFLLEVGIAITTDKDWELLSTRNWVIPFKFDNADTNMEIDPVVVAMHHNSNLWNDCASIDTNMYDAGGVETEILNYLKDCDALGSPMYGTTVHFDRAFLKNNLPRVEAAFHYCNFDVSTLKNYWIAVDGKDDCDCVDNEVHRALPDLMDSIENLTRFHRRFK